MSQKSSLPQAASFVSQVLKRHTQSLPALKVQAPGHRLQRKQLRLHHLPHHSPQALAGHPLFPQTV